MKIWLERALMLRNSSEKSIVDVKNHLVDGKSMSHADPP